MRDSARASIFGEQTADRLDLSGFTPRPAKNTKVPDCDAVRRESDAVLHSAKASLRSMHSTSAETAADDAPATLTASETFSTTWPITSVE